MTYIQLGRKCMNVDAIHITFTHLLFLNVERHAAECLPMSILSYIHTQGIYSHLHSLASQLSI